MFSGEREREQRRKEKERVFRLFFTDRKGERERTKVSVLFCCPIQCDKNVCRKRETTVNRCNAQKTRRTKNKKSLLGLIYLYVRNYKQWE